LEELPKTLDETYARTLEEIDEKKWKYAHIFFQCVAVASRPLRVDELAQFLSFDFDTESTPTFQADWRPEDPARTVLSMCSSLLAVVQPEGYDSPIAQFVHFSVQEYLMSSRLSKAKDTISRFHVSMPPAHTIVAQACLGILLHLDEAITKDSLKSFPLTEYAAQYWAGHARIEDVSSKVQDGMKRLFDPGNSHLSVWVWIYDPEYDGHSWERPGRSERPGKARATPLHYAAFCGMYDVAKFLIVEHLRDVNARGFDLKETPLHVASRRGHADIAQLLLDHGADGKALDDDERTPLFLSSRYGHVEVARILLEHGADTETRNKVGNSPLDWASAEGHVDVAQLLLKYGADANAKDNDGSTALHAASLFGCVGTARVLLEHHDGIDANAQAGDHATPLHLTSKYTFNLEERIDLVRLLVQYGSDINARDDKGRTPFMMATEENCHEIMQLLLEYGAEDHRK
jgi:ankyrin repeat protein